MRAAQRFYALSLCQREEWSRPIRICRPQFPLLSVPKQKYIVGIAPGPPFNIHNPDGTWTGISVELWREIADELGIDFEFRETNLSGNFDGLAQGWLDVAVGPLTITERREEVCDFTHAYFSSSMAVAVPSSRLPNNFRFLVAFFDMASGWRFSGLRSGCSRSWRW